MIDFSQGDSILALWINLPSIDQEAGLVSFTGGIPGGYCGILPGDPGKSNLLGKIVFQVKGVGKLFSDNARVEFLSASQVLLNDGEGTPVQLSFRKAVFTLLPGAPPALKQEWQEELKNDNILPEPFEIEIHENFIIFNTTDKQTGINYYEVKEKGKDWQRAVSPYVLENQEIKGIIKVKAVDKAGNERIAEYRPAKPFPYWIIVIMLIGVGIIWLTIRKLKSKNEKF